MRVRERVGAKRPSSNLIVPLLDDRLTMRYNKHGEHRRSGTGTREQASLKNKSEKWRKYVSNGLTVLADNSRKVVARKEFFPESAIMDDGTIMKLVHRLVDRKLIEPTGNGFYRNYRVIGEPTAFEGLRDDVEGLTYFIWPHLEPKSLQKSASAVPEPEPKEEEMPAALPIQVTTDDQAEKLATPLSAPSDDLTLRFLGALFETVKDMATQQHSLITKLEAMHAEQKSLKADLKALETLWK